MSRCSKQEFDGLLARVKAQALRNIESVAGRDAQAIDDIRAWDPRLADMLSAGIDHRRQISEAILKYVSERTEEK